MILTNFGSIPSSGGSLWLDGWSYGKKITIPANSIDADLTDFPATVYLNSSNFDFTKAKADGSDLRFTDKNLNQLKFERKEHNAYLDIYTPTGSYPTARAITNNAIDFTNYTTIKFKIDVVLSRSQTVYLTNSAGTTTVATLNAITDDSVVATDISSINQSVKVKINADGNSSLPCQLWLKEMWLEDGSGNKTYLYLNGNQYLALTGGWSLHDAKLDNSLYVNGTVTNITSATYNVLIPTVSDLTDTEIYMWYGNSSAYNTSIEAWQDQTGKQLTYNGNVKLVHGVATGKRVASFDGSGDYFSVQNSQDFNYGTGNFTLEVVAKSAINGVHQGMFGLGSVYPGILLLKLNSTNQLALFMSSSGSSWDIANNVIVHTPTLNTAYNYAISRQGSAIRVFVDGVLATTVTSSASIFFDSANFLIGRRQTGEEWNGQFYGMRITKGRARYTSNFTPPTSFTIDGSDVVFCTNFDTIYDNNYVMVQHMGDTLVDASGNGNNGTATGTTVVNTDYGKARNFDGTGDYIDLPLTLANGMTTSATTMMLAKQSDTSPNVLYVFHKATDNPEYRFYLTNSLFSFAGYDNSAYQWLLSTAFTDTSNYHTFAGSNTSNSAKQWLDASIMNTDTSVSFLFEYPTTENRIGYYSRSTGFDLYGIIAEFRQSNIARSDAWIKAESKALNKSLIGITEIQETLPPIGNALSTYTWSQIDLISRAGLASTYWSVGAEKDIVVNGETLTMQIYGFNHDDLTTGGKAGITFGTKHLMANTRRMNSSGTNIGGWTSSEMRSWVTGTLVGQIPSDLSGVLKTVNKYTSAGNASSTINTTQDKLFLFSEIEFDVRKSNTFGGEGKTYPIFPNDESRLKKLSNGSGNIFWWWSRSPRSIDDATFCVVGTSGVPTNSQSANTYQGVAFGFCV